MSSKSTHSEPTQAVAFAVGMQEPAGNWWWRDSAPCNSKIKTFWQHKQWWAGDQEGAIYLAHVVGDKTPPGWAPGARGEPRKALSGLRGVLPTQAVFNKAIAQAHPNFSP